MSPENKPWIGQTKTTLEKRLVQHTQKWKLLKRRKQSYRASCAKLFAAFDRYDPSLWIKTILYYPTNQQEMDDKEIEYIQQYDAIDNGYNICKGGQGIKKDHIDEQHKQNISAARITYFQTPEGFAWKEELSKRYTGNTNPMFGKTHNSYERTDEYKQYMSNVMKGRKPWNTGKTNVYSQETREKMGQTIAKRHAEGRYDYKALGEYRKTLGLHQTEYQKEAVAKALAKEYDFYNPQGELIHVINLRKFCAENGLDQGNMQRVYNKKPNYISHKGWISAKGKGNLNMTKELQYPNGGNFDNYENYWRQCRIINILMIIFPKKYTTII